MGVTKTLLCDFVIFIVVVWTTVAEIATLDTTTSRINDKTEETTNNQITEYSNEASTSIDEESCEVPRINEIATSRAFSTYVNVSISFDNDNETMANKTICSSAQMEINCTATDHWSWVINYANKTIDVTSFDMIDFLLEDLSENTQYFCQLLCMDNSLTIAYSMNFTVATEGVAPSNPQNLLVSNITSSGFILTWEEPEDVRTTLIGYNITVNGTAVHSEGHYLNDCFDPSNRTLNDFIHVNRSNNVYDFQDALADFNYTINISAWSAAGAGNESATSTFTKPQASEPPGNVRHDIALKEFSKNVLMNLILTWDMPCNTNGPVSLFVVQLKGFYHYNASIFKEISFNKSINATASSFEVEVSELMAASNYTYEMYATDGTEESVDGDSYIGTFFTSDNYPSAPNEVSQQISSHNITLSWQEPSNNPGEILGYNLSINYESLNWIQTDFCTLNYVHYNETAFILESEFTTSKIIPGAIYSVQIAGTTSRGTGNWTNLTIVSEEYYPQLLNITCKISQNVIDKDTYNVSGIIEVTPGCFNGAFNSYVISYNGSRADENDHLNIDSITNHSSTVYYFDLKPQRSYVVNVHVTNSYFSSSVLTETFESSAGVPSFDEDRIADIEVNAISSEATITLRREYFNNSRGIIRYLAILVTTENITGDEYNVWKGDVWPDLIAPENIIYYQATPKFWEPFNESDSVDYVLGQNTSCNDEEQFCNRPLVAGETYYVFIRMFTANYYRNTDAIRFVTKAVSRLGLILGIIFGLLFISAVGFFGFILWRKGLINLPIKRIVDDPSQRNQCQNNTDTDRDPLIRKCLNRDISSSTTELTKEEFMEYCNILEHNPHMLNKEWQDLEIKSQIIYKDLESHFATLPENRRKNRYTNILPFDHSRVKINIYEDDEMCSDYINASYIKGFSNRNEYIATQGPLPHTVRDFWKMVFQENVTLIIMVARFVENKKEKCHKYFPNNHESMMLGDDIEVRCRSELDFQVYCVRTLQVRKNLKQLTVTHWQFLEWPDFGVPEGTDNLSRFCHQLRERRTREPDEMTVVHCSAGVGRSGTIIAVDILIQAIEAGKKIDVFNTVVEMRRQRKCMVQTEKQYMYIYQLVKSILEGPIENEDETLEHLYENIELSHNAKNGLVESAL